MNVRSSDDRTTRARIRDAAIELIARQGVADLSARGVADRAGVSPGSVIHHFRSMDGLRRACDEFVAETIRTRKSEAQQPGAAFDLATLVRDTDLSSLPAYLAAVVSDDSAAVTQLVDEMVADAVAYSEQGVASGMLRHSDDPQGRAALMVVWSLGALVLHRHLARHLDVDLTDPDVMSTPGFARYLRTVYEVVGSGLFTESFAAVAQQAAAELHAPGEEAT